MKFVNFNNVKCNYADMLCKEVWNFSDDKQGVEFVKLFLNYKISNGYSNDKELNALENFNKLKNFNNTGKLFFSSDVDGVVNTQDNCVSYIDRGKDKTIVAISGGSWMLSLYQDQGIEHQYAWMFDDDNFNDYNIISLVEHPKRAFTNPMLYDSCMYDGINDELNNLNDVCDFIKTLIPNQQYYLISDCKTTHACALMSYYLNAHAVFMSSGATHSNYQKVLYSFTTPIESSFVDINNADDIGFELCIRQQHFTKKLPKYLKCVNSIASKMPETKFEYVYHKDDKTFYKYINHIQNSSNVNVYGIDDTPYCYGKHYIVIQLRSDATIANFFNSS